MNRGLYAYAITRDHRSDLAGSRLIAHRDLALVVAEVDLDRFAGITAEMAREPSADSPLVAFVQEHDRVVRAVFEREPVLPLRFGTILGSVEDARHLLSTRHGEVASWLERVEGRREWGVRVRAAAAPASTEQGHDWMSG
ncbi:MAG: GvpL/GvpF family gas vesicle protein, partial [Umezawaea sp.]